MCLVGVVRGDVRGDVPAGHRFRRRRWDPRGGEKTGDGGSGSTGNHTCGFRVDRRQGSVGVRSGPLQSRNGRRTGL